MSAKPQAKALVVCPRCGHQQSEPPRAVSTTCRQCGQHLRVQELLHPPRAVPIKAPEQKGITCFDCGAELQVASAAQSAMCKRCGRYIDLQDYAIHNAVSKNFKTKGRFVVEPKGYVFNTEVVARDIVIKGRVIGQLTAEHSLTLYSTAEIKGTLQTPLLVIPADNWFRVKEPLGVGSVEIIGELVGDLRAEKRVIIRATGRLFGNVQTQDLIVEEGAVLVGRVSVGAAGRGGWSR